MVIHESRAQLAGPSASQCPVEPRAGQLGIRACPREIELGLQQRGLRIQHVGIGRDARAESLGEHAPRLRGGANARLGRLDRRAAQS